MITLITAVPGSGKSLFAVGLVLKAVEEGRPVYSNISGLDIPECRPAPDDWRDTMEGALVIYDEAQQDHLYPSTGHGREIKDTRLKAMETHRHTGHDLVFISQSPSFINHHIRKLAGEHIHLYRAFGMKTVTKYTWQHCVDSPNDRGEQSRADSVPWPFPKAHMKLYKSATIHTHKFKVPKKLAFMLFLILLSSAAVAYNISTTESSFLISKEEAPAPSTPAASPEKPESAVRVGAAGGTNRTQKPATTEMYDWGETEQATPVAGCISSKTQCQCYSAEGNLLKMSYPACMSAITNPLPRSIIVGASSSGPRDTKSKRSSNLPGSTADLAQAAVGSN